jgi:hypothetical protein
VVGNITENGMQVEIWKEVIMADAIRETVITLL